jgi:hypothetical protein
MVAASAAGGQALLELKAELSQTRAAVDAWAGQQQHAAKHLKDGHMAWRVESEGKADENTNLVSLKELNNRAYAVAMGMQARLHRLRARWKL